MAEVTSANASGGGDPPNKSWSIRDGFAKPLNPAPSTCGVSEGCLPFPTQPPRPTPIGYPATIYGLAQVITPEQLELINSSQIMAFHCIGDTGGDGMGEEDNAGTFAVGRLIASQLDPGNAQSPCFCYHVGDIIYHGDGYPGGASELYSYEFYQPYQFYNNAILTIPGNHDSYDYNPKQGVEALTGYRDNFLSPRIMTTDMGRPVMNLPYYYWVLETPLATIIGLCTICNCIDDHQLDWFKYQMKNADPDKCLIVASHFPPYTFDSEAGTQSYSAVVAALNDACAAANRAPDLVLSGHSHNYQRITVKQQWTEKTHICIISGAGGHGLTPVDQSVPNIMAKLDYHNDTSYGALTVTIDANKREIRGAYFLAPYQRIEIPPPPPVDHFTIKY